MSALPDPPAQLKAIQSYMKIAADIERVDPVVAYWVRLYSTETALSIDRDSPECKTFLGALILWLEKFKQSHKDNEATTNQTVGQAHMENFVVALFNKADTLDRDGTANKNTVKMFYMAAVLFEAMAVFGPLTEEISKRAKYAKFKAAYIQKCLKTGQTPKPGPIEGTDLEDPSYSVGGGETGGSESQPPPAPSDLPAAPDSLGSKQDPFILNPSPAPVYPPASRPPLPPTTPNQPSEYSEPKRVAQSPATPSANSSFNTSGTVTMNTTTSKSDTCGSGSLGARFQSTSGAPLSAEDIMKSQKYCKFANSALQYDDIPTAVANLEKALKLLTTGQNPE